MVSSNIINNLGMGSGIDVKQLVSDLSEASRAPKVERLSTLARQNSARISAVAQARSDLDSFANSLEQMITDGSLRSQAKSSDESALTVTSRPGFSADSFSATLVVNQLARAQTSYSAAIADRTAAIGEGTLSLTVGSKSFAISIGPDNNSLDGLAAAINASDSGVTASLISDDNGTRLILKGQNGTANAFSLSADAGGDPALAAFATSGGAMTMGQAAANAEFTVDGVAFSRATNNIDDVLPGMSIALKKATPGQPIDIGASRPLDMIRQTVGDFVDVYNQLRKSLSEASKLTGTTGSLRQLESELAGLIGKTLSSHPTINKLSDIGVSTTKEGTLVLDQAKLDKMLQQDSGAVEALFNPRRDGTHNASTDIGIAGALDAIRDKAVAPDGLLDRITQSLDARKKSIQLDYEKVEAREAAYKARLEKQYGGLEAKLASYKATQSYLTQQIEMWNNQYK